MKNMEENSEMIWKIWKKGKSNNEKIVMKKFMNTCNLEKEEEDEEDISLGVIMTNTEIFHIFHIISIDR
jgi:hypothetical protein